MKLILSAQDIQAQLQAEKRLGQSLPSASDGAVLNLPRQIADGCLHWTRLREGLSLEVNQFSPRQNFALKGDSSTASAFPLRLLFFLSGRSRSLTCSGTTRLEKELLPAHSLLTLVDDAAITVDYACGQPIQTVGIGLELEAASHWLEAIATVLPPTLQRILEGGDLQLYEALGPTTPAMQTTLHQVLHCPFHGVLRQLYLEGKTIELMALKLAQLQGQEQTNHPGSPLKSGDVERIHLARDILLRDLEHPPSLLELARLAGINDYKLKRGFRQVFGTTVFGYLRTQRLETARQLLIEQGCTVSEVALMVGYSSLSRFNAAFKQQFGVSPGAYRYSEHK